MNKLKYLFIVIAILLSNMMCAVVAYNYRGLVCAIAHRGFSAPASIALFTAIPFLIGIVVCIVLAIKFSRK